jgi:uncharacterized protein YbaA (DUF1428 family)
MTYIEGFVIAVPTANKDKFIEHARIIDEVFMEHGALRILECWGDDVPHGKLTDFYGAVQARDDESVVFSWIEWPDKATRDAKMAELQKVMETDPRFSLETNPTPFDGRRMIYGGFQPVVVLGG